MSDLSIAEIKNKILGHLRDKLKKKPYTEETLEALSYHEIGGSVFSDESKIDLQDRINFNKSINELLKKDRILQKETRNFEFYILKDYNISLGSSTNKFLIPLTFILALGFILLSGMFELLIGWIFFLYSYILSDSLISIAKSINRLVIKEKKDTIELFIRSLKRHLLRIILVISVMVIFVSSWIITILELNETTFFIAATIVGLIWTIVGTFEEDMRKLKSESDTD